jgi:hypothetical protein
LSGDEVVRAEEEQTDGSIRSCEQSAKGLAVRGVSDFEVKSTSEQMIDCTAMVGNVEGMATLTIVTYMAVFSGLMKRNFSFHRHKLKELFVFGQKYSLNTVSSLVASHEELSSCACVEPAFH